jgi:hypothetical protein
MCTRFLLFAFLVALPVVAQEPDSASQVPTGSVTGVVYDSIAGVPLEGATVQLVAVGEGASGGHSVLTDSLGRYTASGVMPGRYLLGFFHPVLDSLGVDAPAREVVVPAAGIVHADLSVPGSKRLRGAVCGEDVPGDSSALVVGTVRHARSGAPVYGAKVAAEWLELSFTSRGVLRRTPTLAATTGENGWFALCGVPAGGSIVLLAAHDADSTDRVEVQVPANGFLRRDLYLGEAMAVVPGDSAQSADGVSQADSAAKAAMSAHVAHPLRKGEGRLRGTVLAATGGRPLGGAQVSIVDGPVTRTNDRGEWTLEQLPMGTRMLEVRAVGFYPQRRPVQVVFGAPPVRLALSTMKSVLDTIRVTARISDPASNGFEQRRRSGMGHYLSAREVATRSSVFTSSVFRTVQGLRMERDATGNTHLYQRGAFGWCQPDVYLNGHYIAGATADDIDSWVLPEAVTGIEVYDESMVPPQFQRALTGCGSVLIWSK